VQRIQTDVQGATPWPSPIWHLSGNTTLDFQDDVMDIYLPGTFHCFNSLKARGILDTIPENVKQEVRTRENSAGM
jgi:hypothetical protein